MKYNKKIKYICIVIFGSVLDILLHIMSPDGDSNSPIETNGSILTRILGFELTALLYFFVTFGVLSYIFYRYESKLQGTKVMKGLKYGVAIGILWLWGMLEGPSLWGTTIMHEFITGVCDSIPIVLIGVLLGVFTTENNYEKKIKIRYPFIPIITFSVIFLAGRYSLYYTGIIVSGYQTSPHLTFIWTLFMGTCIGITYLLLGKVTGTSSITISAIKFGIIIFGVNWGLYTIFIPLVFDMGFTDAILRVLCDTLWVIISYYFSAAIEKLIERRAENRNAI